MEIGDFNLSERNITVSLLYIFTVCYYFSICLKELYFFSTLSGGTKVSFLAVSGKVVGWRLWVKLQKEANELLEEGKGVNITIQYCI